MNGIPPRTLHRHKAFVRAFYALNFFAIALAIITLVAVGRVMQAFQTEMREWAIAKNDPAMLASFEEAVAHDLNVMFGILAATVLAACLLVGTGLAMLWKSK
jgi:amino acid transporter